MDPLNHYLLFCVKEMKSVDLQVLSWTLSFSKDSNSFNSLIVSFLPRELESSMRRLSHATEKNRIATVLWVQILALTDFFCGVEQIISSPYALAYSPAI